MTTAGLQEHAQWFPHLSHVGIAAKALPGSRRRPTDCQPLHARELPVALQQCRVSRGQVPLLASTSGGRQCACS